MNPRIPAVTNHESQKIIAGIIIMNDTVSRTVVMASSTVINIRILELVRAIG